MTNCGVLCRSNILAIANSTAITLQRSIGGEPAHRRPSIWGLGNYGSRVFVFRWLVSVTRVPLLKNISLSEATVHNPFSFTQIHLILRYILSTLVPNTWILTFRVGRHKEIKRNFKLDRIYSPCYARPSICFVCFWVPDLFLDAWTWPQPSLIGGIIEVLQ